MFSLVVGNGDAISGRDVYVCKAYVCGAVAIILFLYVVDVVIQCIRCMKR